jgi:hypothetical protein
MRKLAALLGLYFWFVTQAAATITCSLPFTLTNGTTADATQVMANYQALVTCFTQAASAGANNDITSLSGLLTPIGPTVGGSNVFLGGTASASANDYTLATTTPTGYSNTQGYSVVFKPGASNTGATRLNVNGQGLTNVYKITATGPQPLVGGELVNGQQTVVWYDGTQFVLSPFPLAGWGLVSSGNGIQIQTTNPPYDANAPVNAGFAASVSANVLTISLKGNNGSDPSVTNPVLIPFRDVTIATGTPSWVAVTSALSINTNAAGATLGTANNVPFRFWIVAFNNGGTAVLALINASTDSSGTAAIYPLVPNQLASSTGISAAATSAGVFYTPNGTAVSSKAYTILGYLDYDAGLATAGSYASVPSKLQLFGAGIKKPGEVVQAVQALTSTTAIVPTTSVNLVKVQASTTSNTAGAAAITCSVLRGVTTLYSLSYNGAATNAMPFTYGLIDNPRAATSQVYSLSGAFCAPSSTLWLLEEIMG